MEINDINDLWERQSDESSKAFKAFDTYLKMGYKRSLKKVAMQLGLNSVRHLNEWKKQFEWDSRLLAYENDQNRQQNLANFEIYKQITEKQLSLASNLRQLLKIPLAIIDERMKKDQDGKIKAIDDFRKLDTVEMYHLIIDSSRFIDIVVKIERLAIGQPTDIDVNNNSLENTPIVIT